MKSNPCDFRRVVFLPGQKIAYARRGSDGRIYLQSATIEEVSRTHRYLKSNDDKGFTTQLDDDYLLVRTLDGSKRTLTRFGAIAVLEEE